MKGKGSEFLISHN